MKKALKNLFLFFIMGITLFAKTNTWPKEPVTITVPWAVGGLADQANRAIAQQGQKYLGQPIVPANRTGAGGVVALTEFLREKPNSPKLIYGGEGSFAIGPLFNKVPYKWDDFEPVVNIYKSTFILVSNPKLNISSLEELKEYGKSNKIIFAVAGLNSSEYLMLAALLTEMGLNFEGVSFDGANEAMNATISGDTTIGITHASLAKEYVKANKLIPVVAFDEKPLNDEVYNLKPVTEYGYDTFFVNRCILLARKGTSKEVIEKMYATVVEIFKDPEFLKTANNLGLVLDPIGPEESKKHIEDSIEKANRFYKLLNK
ncbi:tripartite tricarboxylate transporter substrate-binding protein [Cetobacterium somerae]|uniref:tripartite tricarboxylate transporter substrate binding protein n=1 Tax=Cetobacterium TaxID=180162 RepID=UPI00224CB192|nr:tripartite tricarboxylate transporter substrate-binding protein [Cetobacterium somerae]MCX3065984.1 tripartite tricarboxylate transporter substrate-binding protein [Cetobacterium somerae]